MEKPINIDELIKEIRTLTAIKKVTTLRGLPFYGKVMINFQDGNRVHMEIRETVK